MVSNASAHAMHPQFPRRRRSIGSTIRGLAFWLRGQLPHAATSEFRLPILGLQVTVGSRTLFARQLSKYRAYEADNSNWVLRTWIGQHAGLFVDVGANFGWYSVIFSACAAGGGKVVAIEPDRENFALLSRNIKVNALSNVDLLNVGVGSRRMTATLSSLDRSNPGAHSVRPVRDAYASSAIEIYALDELLAPYPGTIDLLKMDIEGYEVDALLGAPATLARTQNVLVEYSPRFLKACGREPSALLEILRGHGFVPHFIEAGVLRETTVEEVQRSVGEGLAAGHWQVDLGACRTFDIKPVVAQLLSSFRALQEKFHLLEKLRTCNINP